MENIRGKKILLIQQRGWGVRIGHFLAKKLSAQGARLAAVTVKQTTHDFTVEQKEVKYEMITSYDEVINEPLKYLAGDDFSLAQICAELGVASVWPLVATLRNHVRSYGQKYYYGFKQNLPDEELVIYVKAAFKQVKSIFDGFGPELIITPNFVELFHIMLNLYAKKRGVKMIAVTASTVRGIRIFTDGFNEDSGEFYDRVDELNAGAVSSNLPRAKEYIKKFRQEFIKPESADNLLKKLTLKQKIRHAVSPFYQSWLFLINPRENYLKNLGVTVDYRPPRIIFRDHYARDRYKKFMDEFSYFPLEKVGQCVYFPLQFQPEATTDVAAPFFNNLIETARQVAMSLPDDYTLVVKEHPAMVGLRSPSYIEKLALTPNVKLIDYRVSGQEIFKKADLIISPGGTSLAEAAYYRKPVIQLGNLGTTLKLPNVFKHTDMTTLSEKIKQVLKADLRSEIYEKKLENFLAAAFDTGFSFNYWGVWSRCEQADMQELWRIYEKEINKILNH